MQPVAAKSASSTLLRQGDLIGTGRQPAAAFRGSKLLLREIVGKNMGHLDCFLGKYALLLITFAFSCFSKL